MVQQAFQKQTRDTVSYFNSSELSDVLEVYEKRVRNNEWRDYGIICADRATTFVILDNGRDIASLSKLKEGSFVVKCGSYSLETDDFPKALHSFKTDFGNKKPKRQLRIVG